MLVCDSQVHAPQTPHSGQVGGIDGPELIRAMDEAGIDRCILVPLESAGDDTSLNNAASLALADLHPYRFGVMGRFDLRDRSNAARLAGWKVGQMLGIRLSFGRDPNRSLLASGALDWFWSAAETAQVPVMLMMPASFATLADIATKHLGLAMIVDHMALKPHITYNEHDLTTHMEGLVALARLPNIAVKASALPCSIAESYPFAMLREPMRRTIDAFGPDRVFWGSDLSRLTCTYLEWKRFFLEELPHLTASDKEEIMGRGLLRWLNWR